MKTIVSIGLIALLISSQALAGNPFIDLLNLPTPSQSATSVVPPNDTPKEPFLKAFQVVYEGDWVAIIDGQTEYYSVNIFTDDIVCNEDESECCGTLEARLLEETATSLSCKFCLVSTYEINIRDDVGKLVVKCIGVKGARMESPFHPALGYAIDDPTTIHCGGIFTLVRPE